MADDLYRVELTASFLERLDAIETFLTEADAAFAFDRLLAELRATVIPNLARFPRIGRRHLDNPPQSAEALAQLHAQRAYFWFDGRQFVVHEVVGARRTVALPMAPARGAEGRA